MSRSIALCSRVSNITCRSTSEMMLVGIGGIDPVLLPGSDCVLVCRSSSDGSLVSLSAFSKFSTVRLLVGLGGEYPLDDAAVPRIGG